MLGDVSAGAEPHSVVLTRMLEEFDQPHRLGWTADQPIMKIDRHHLRMLGAFFVEQVETVHHVARKAVGGAETRVAVEAIVVGLEEVGITRWCRLPNLTQKGSSSPR